MTERIVFYDTEFNDDGKTIELISIGACDNFGNEFYAISTEFQDQNCNPWVREHVLPRLPDRSSKEWMSRAEIRDILHAWLATPERPNPEMWAYYSAYDHVALAQLWGPMTHMPDDINWYTNDLMTLWKQAGRPTKPQPSATEHDALADARWNRDLYNICTTTQRG